MFTILPNLIARLKAMLLTFLVAELEGDLIAIAAERKAELLRQANHYKHEDLSVVADQMRTQAESLAPDKPLASVVATIAHLKSEPTSNQAAPNQSIEAAPPPPAPESTSQPAEAPPATSKKKKH